MHDHDDLPDVPPPGPGATVAGVAGVCVVILGFIANVPLFVAAGLITLLCSYVYAELRDRRQREILADEYLRRRDA